LTHEQIIEGCLTSFGANFAETWAEKVVLSQSLRTLWDLIEESETFGLSKPDLEKLKFRSAYILEAVYYKNPTLFYPFLLSFFELFPTVTNGSMRRHFAKICYYEIKKGSCPPNIEAIATACADWIIDPKTRVAVKVWALDILLELSKTESWINELLSDVIASLSTNPSAGMLVRLRRIKSNIMKIFL
jgi:hypothetical protein